MDRGPGTSYKDAGLSLGEVWFDMCELHAQLLVVVVMVLDFKFGCVGFGFQVVVEWLGLAFTKEW